MPVPSVKRKRWAEIQVGELEYHEAKDESRVLAANLPYWKSLLAVLPSEVRFDEHTRVLDLGCGGCGILLALEHGRLVGVDPLMDRYIQKFPFLTQRNDITWIAGTAEEADLRGPFDVVFAINSFDHVYDPERVAARIESLLAPGGHLVVTMNCHNTRLFRAYYRRLYRFIDHHHPYQFSPADVETLFSNLIPLHRRSIDDLWFPHARRYYEEVLRRPIEDKRKWIKGAANPLKWPMAFCKLVLDMPPHKKRPGQRSIYDNVLFVFRAR